MHHCSSDVAHMPQCRLPAPQAGMLGEMELFAARSQSTAESWASEREAAFTETLDAQLRRHRPRAGRVEEEVRAQRSVELMAQRRKTEGHMARQSKAVKQQQVHGMFGCKLS